MSDYKKKFEDYNNTISAKRNEEIRLLTLSEKRGKYEQTPEWRKRCSLRKKGANNTCEQCFGEKYVKGKKIKLHVHHITYDRYGCELWEDLKILCVPCHKEFHKTYPHHNRHFARTKVVKQTNMDYPIQDFFT